MTCKLCKSLKDIGWNFIYRPVDDKDAEVCIEVNEKTKEIELTVFHADLNYINVPIKFCPFCGKNFKKTIKII